MRTLTTLFFTLFFAVCVAAQTSTPPPAPSASPATPAVSPNNLNISVSLDRLQSAATQVNSDISRMRIEKWKADADSKHQAQSNADSIQRNLTSALPGLIATFRNEPQNLNAGFKLYRNLNALYDVLSSFTETAGAFGPKADIDALAQQVNVIDDVRRSLGDNLEAMTAQTEAELTQLRAQVHALQEAAVPPPPAKKVVVDNAEQPKKPAHKKKATAASGSQAPANSAASPSSPPKSQ